MKKYHGQSLAFLIRNTADPNEPLTLTAAQFANLDLWSVPRGRSILIENVPAVGGLIMCRNSKALRFDLLTISLPFSRATANVRRVCEVALRGAANVCRQFGMKIAYQRRLGWIVVWQPLCRNGGDTMERVCADFLVLWKQAIKLLTASGQIFDKVAAIS